MPHALPFRSPRAKPRWGPRELFFRVSMAFKGIDGVLELLGGAALLLVSPASIQHLVQLVTQDEIAEDPRDLVANALLRLASHLSLHGEHFVAVYLLVHGITKVGLVWALLRRVLVAYPIAMAIFGAFLAYQLYRYSIAPQTGLLLLCVLDVVVIGLVLLEYRALRGAH